MGHDGLQQILVVFLKYKFLCATLWVIGVEILLVLDASIDPYGVLIMM
jgi:hypothetical protein